MIFAILLILPAAVLRAMNIVETNVVPFMLMPSGMLMGVIVFYVIHKRKDKCCAKCQRTTQQPVQTPLTQPAMIVDRHPDPPVDNQNGPDNENTSNKDTDSLLKT